MPSQNVGGGRPKGPGQLGRFYLITTRRGSFIGQYVAYAEHREYGQSRRRSRMNDRLTFVLADGRQETVQFKHLVEDALPIDD